MRKIWLLGLALEVCLAAQNAFAVPINDRSDRISVVWNRVPARGSIEVDSGRISGLYVQEGALWIENHEFRADPGGKARLEIALEGISEGAGTGTTVVQVATDSGSFSFFLRDVNADYPICLPLYGVAVLPAEDRRSYDEVFAAVRQRGDSTKRQRIEQRPEASFEAVAPKTRCMQVPIWLGLTRDVRMFELSEESQENFQEDKVLKPIFSTTPSRLPESNNEDVFYRYALGRGIGPYNNISRYLEQGALPVYHSVLQDDDIRYHSVAFVAFERSELTAGTVQGTDFEIADKFSNRVFPADRKAEVDAKVAAWSEPEETVFYCRTEIENTGSVPRYAWMKVPRPGNNKWSYVFDARQGFSRYAPQRVFCVSRYEGKPMPQEELAVLLQPGERVHFDFYVPHEPLNEDRAQRLAEVPFERKYAESVAYWEHKLAAAAYIRVPERRIDEMLRAGLLHLDMITFGRESDETLSPNVGVYGPIGTESAPIIQYYLSMGLDEQARRSLNYFLVTQKENGQIENFNGYTVETGAALWSIGEYYRYTLDSTWIRQVAPRLMKACNFLIDWRNRNKREELRGRGYGMVEGKVADPVDPYHQFMLNGYSYLGLSRMAEVLGALGYEQASEYAREAEAWKQDIRSSFFESMSRSPIVPLGDGTWSPTVPPWTEADAPRLLYRKAEVFRSHGTFTAPDGLLGPLYLVFCEVIDPEEKAASQMADYYGELLLQGNSPFSQPYYSRYNWYQLRRGMVKPFLNTYYTVLSAHADRETYSFWEHFYRLSPHKTHEEANFLMESRWMLYMEQRDTLHLLRTIPRAWLQDGKTIELDGVRSYFGALTLRVDSRLSEGYIGASLRLDDRRKPSCVTLRLPHPQGRQPVRVIGGTYDPVTESVTITAPEPEVRVRVEY